MHSSADSRGRIFAICISGLELSRPGAESPRSAAFFRRKRFFTASTTGHNRRARTLGEGTTRSGAQLLQRNRDFRHLSMIALWLIFLASNASSVARSL